MPVRKNATAAKQRTPKVYDRAYEVTLTYTILIEPCCSEEDATQAARANVGPSTKPQFVSLKCIPMQHPERKFTAP